MGYTNFPPETGTCKYLDFTLYPETRQRRDIERCDEKQHCSLLHVYWFRIITTFFDIEKCLNLPFLPGLEC